MRQKYKYLPLLSMLFLTIMFADAVLEYKPIQLQFGSIMASSFVFPFWFLITDIIAEIYGYRITQTVIITGYIVQTIFAFICALVLAAPAPSFFHEERAYTLILGNSFLWIDISGFFAYITANLLNTYILTRWKVLLKGRKFWLRSLGSSIFSEAFYSFLAILMMELKSISLDNILKVVLISFSIKVLYCLVFAFPGNVLVTKLKKFTGIDVYDLPKKYTPFKYLSKRFGMKDD